MRVAQIGQPTEHGSAKRRAWMNWRRAPLDRHLGSSQRWAALADSKTREPGPADWRRPLRILALARKPHLRCLLTLR